MTPITGETISINGVIQDKGVIYHISEEQRSYPDGIPSSLSPLPILARDAEKPGYVTMTVLITFAIALLLDGLLGYLFTNTQRVTSPAYATQAIFLGPFFVPKGQFYAAVVSVGLIGLVWAFLKFSRMGYAIRATTQNRAASQLLGVNVAQVSLFTFGLLPLELSFFVFIHLLVWAISHSGIVSERTSVG